MLLSSDLWVSALTRRVEQAGSFAYIARRGDKSFGAVLVKVLNLKTRETYVLREAQKGEESVWMQPVETKDEADLDAWIARQVRYDPDIWVVEIEDAEGRHFLTETVEDMMNR
ncbi:DUF1491 family protein [Asticcacaulis taihuensis]|jgi:hypothetical protein|uniref:DUF1491 domain-containing protein n=1 Tax=Asticcacaulis taihuensis TaxID=260084 RepID=A0A1G4TSX4_9CAUL|nr:DUF1491 family protein [Asticcacaulis taihuensis]SCW83835.1 hypothetical protein SAMN02927928_0110 [Asticcacaulis taihuensis]